MAQAVCFHCGAMKFGALLACDSCSRRPEAEEDLALSLAMSAEYFDLQRLNKFSAQVRNGGRPDLSPQSRARMLQRSREAEAPAPALAEIPSAA